MTDKSHDLSKSNLSQPQILSRPPVTSPGITSPVSSAVNPQVNISDVYGASKGTLLRESSQKSDPASVMQALQQDMQKLRSSTAQSLYQDDHVGKSLMELKMRKGKTDKVERRSSRLHKTTSAPDNAPKSVRKSSSRHHSNRSAQKQQP